MKNNGLGIIGGISVLVIFILVSYLLQTNMDFVKKNLDLGIFGVFLYVFITAFATVVAPISAIPLLPVAVFLWGWFYAGILSVIGWTIGSVIAFIIGRKFGIKIVRKFVSLDKINYYESFIPKKDLFLGIILIRIFLPVDLLSYLLGIFSKVSLRTYALATFIGVISLFLFE
jgi:uncharacterized membrane protein YdjX (TVP38/TMEM64 family)